MHYFHNRKIFFQRIILEVFLFSKPSRKKSKRKGVSSEVVSFEVKIMSQWMIFKNFT
jgi:hypothetical protein